jgi:hypothetical protein
MQPSWGFKRVLYAILPAWPVLGRSTMSTIRIAGADYMTSQFNDFWKEFYDTKEKMEASVKILEASPYIHLPTLEYGRFQPILAPSDATWGKGGVRKYMEEMGTARLNLTAQKNEQDLPKDEADKPRPLTRCALLDTALRKCFNSKPPIPMTVSVAQKTYDDPTCDVHSIDLRWDYDRGDDTPTRLHFTMICPYKPPLPIK